MTIRELIRINEQERAKLAAMLQQAEAELAQLRAQLAEWEDVPDGFHDEVTDPDGRTELDVHGDFLFLRYEEFDTGFDCKLRYDLVGEPKLRIQRRKEGNDE